MRSASWQIKMPTQTQHRRLSWLGSTFDLPKSCGVAMGSPLSLLNLLEGLDPFNTIQIQIQCSNSQLGERLLRSGPVGR